MIELAIIGGGFFGVAAALEARRLGVDAQVIDSDATTSGSRNAAGILHEPSKRVRDRIPEAWGAGPWGYGWLRAHGLVSKAAEVNWSYRGARYKSSDVELVSPVQVLNLVLPVRRTISRLIKLDGGWRLAETAGGHEFEARRVIVAAGVWTDELLMRSGLTPIGVGALRGRALIIEMPQPVWPEPVHSWTVRPYTTFTLRPWPQSSRPGAHPHWRFGDTVEPASGKPFIELSEARKRFLPQAVEHRTMMGYRPVTPQVVCEEIRPGLIVMTGGHRSGLALAEPAAHRAMELISG